MRETEKPTDRQTNRQTFEVVVDAVDRDVDGVGLGESVPVNRSNRLTDKLIHFF